MPKFIIKLNEHYLEWSTVVDAPVTYGMTLEEFKTYYRDEYGRRSMAELEDRLARVEQTGTSAIGYDSVDDVIRHNRAGKGEKELTKKEIVRIYVTNRPKEAK